MQQFEQVRQQNQCLAVVPFVNDRQEQAIGRVHVVKLPQHDNYLAVVRVNSDAGRQIVRQKFVDLAFNDIVATANVRVRANNAENKSLIQQVWQNNYAHVGHLFDGPEDQQFGLLDLDIQKISKDNKVIFQK